LPVFYNKQPTTHYYCYAPGTKADISSDDTGAKAGSQLAIVLVRKRIKGSWIETTASGMEPGAD
jgi:hypothetical protein